MQRGIFYTEEELTKIIRLIECMDADIGSLWNKEEIWKTKPNVQLVLSCLTRDIDYLKKKILD